MVIGQEYRIMLINSPNSATPNKRNANYALFPHIGLIQLATRLKKELGSCIAIQIADGGISDTETIQEHIKKFQPHLVGISVLTPTYCEGLKIAEYAKNCGAVVVLGDEHAIFFPQQILERRLAVDYIIANDVGEQPFFELVSTIINKGDVSRCSSLYYRDDGEIKKTFFPRYMLQKENTVPDLSLIADTLNIYAENYNRAHGHLHDRFMKVVTINNARGCENGRVRCSYCSIADLSINTGKPSQFWHTIEHYHQDHGINLFFEVYDSFTASPTYIEALLQCMPPAIEHKIELGEIELMVYARALGLIKKDNVNKLKKLGVKRVNIGLDSGDSDMLLAQRKNKTTNEINVSALEMLVNAGMTVHGSYILGAPGETVDSIQHTVDHIKNTLSTVKYSSIEISRLTPLANSPIWDMMINFDRPLFYKNADEVAIALDRLHIKVPKREHEKLRDKYLHQDLFDTEELIHDWYKYFTHVNEKYVIDVIDHVDELIASCNIQTGKNIG